MNLNMHAFMKLYDHVRRPEFNYMQASPAYGVARWVMPGWHIEVINSKLSAWGPVEKWSKKWQHALNYERVEVSHDDFYIEVEAHAHTLVFLSKHSKLNNMAHLKHYEHCYDLDHVGDLSMLQGVFLYHDLAMKV